MVFKATGARTFKLKVRIPTRNDGKPRTFSTGMRDKSAAADVERMVQRMKARRDYAALEFVFDDEATLPDVYAADVSGRLDAKLAELRDVDLNPHLAEWAVRAKARYVTQVRRFIPEGERFPRSRFRRKNISTFLAGLDVDDPTRNRYRAALSSFAKWLVERELLETNPVRDVAMYKENDPRMVWMTWVEAEGVVKAEPSLFLRALFALMAGSGIELGAALRVRRSDIDLEASTVHARGSKTIWRNRVIRIEPWAMPYVRPACGDDVGPWLVFPPMPHRDILAAFRAAQKTLGIEDHRLHDLRHCYAVNALKQGYKPTVVAHQLGHKDATMVTKVYGRFIPDASDYVVTNPATSPENSPEAPHAKS
jgi:integrase